MSESLRSILELPNIGREISLDVSVENFRKYLHKFKGKEVVLSYNYSGGLQEDFLHATFRIGRIVDSNFQFGHILLSSYFWTVDPKDVIDVIPVSALQDVRKDVPLKSFHLEASNEGEEFEVIHTDPYRASLQVASQADYMPKWFEVTKITPVTAGIIHRHL